MKITGIRLSILEAPVGDTIFGLHNVPGMARIRWTHDTAIARPGFAQAVHVETDEGIKGLVVTPGTTGDHEGSYLRANLEQLRTLVVGEDPLDRAEAAPGHSLGVPAAGLVRHARQLFVGYPRQGGGHARLPVAGPGARAQWKGYTTGGWRSRCPRECTTECNSCATRSIFRS